MVYSGIYIYTHTFTTNQLYPIVYMFGIKYNTLAPQRLWNDGSIMATRLDLTMVISSGNHPRIAVHPWANNKQFSRYLL